MRCYVHFSVQSFREELESFDDSKIPGDSKIQRFRTGLISQWESYECLWFFHLTSLFRLYFLRSRSPFVEKHNGDPPLGEDLEGRRKEGRKEIPWIHISRSLPLPLPRSFFFFISYFFLFLVIIALLGSLSCTTFVYSPPVPPHAHSTSYNPPPHDNSMDISVSPSFFLFLIIMSHLIFLSCSIFANDPHNPPHTPLIL